MTTIGIRDHFVEIWDNEQTAPYGKPDPRVLTPLLKKLETNKYRLSQFIYIGDSLGDYQIATGNSIDFIAVTTGLHSRRDFMRVGVQRNQIKRSLEELIPVSR